MSKKEIKQIIKQETLRDMPDVLSKINLDEIEIKEHNEKLKRNKFLNTKILIPIFSMCIVFILVGIILFTTRGPQINTRPLKAKEELYSFSSITAVSLLSSDDSKQALALRYAYNSNSSYDRYIDDMSKYLSALEYVVGNEFKPKLEELTSGSYQYKATIRTYNLLNTAEVFTIYYNIVEIDDEEIEYAGYMIYNNKRYSLEAKMEKDEESTEFELEAIAEDSSKVVVSQEIENDVQSFLYEFESAKGLETTTEITIKSENNKLEIELEIEIENSYEAEYDIKKNDRKQEFLIDFAIKDFENDLKLEGAMTVTVDALTGNYIFKIDESEYEKNRNSNLDEIGDD